MCNGLGATRVRRATGIVRGARVPAANTRPTARTGARTHVARSSSHSAHSLYIARCTLHVATSESTPGFTLIELLIVIAIIGILFTIALPYLLTARTSADEASAISSLEAINSAQEVFKHTCGQERYASTLTALGTPAPTTGIAFLSPDLSSTDTVTKSGYEITLTGTVPDAPAKACNGTDTAAGYAATADPLQPGRSGTRYFATNTTRVIYQSAQSMAGKTPETGAPEGAAELK
jgi:type IV pilus assembly protein PilA